MVPNDTFIKIPAEGDKFMGMPYFCREVKFHIISMGSRLIVQNQFSFITNCQLQT